jgi:hypothetical protein
MPAFGARHRLVVVKRLVEMHRGHVHIASGGAGLIARNGVEALNVSGQLVHEGRTRWHGYR